jgi:HD-GYP domain-containing protein (c-di-GMP phosphodiesterase class II)
MDAMDQHIQLVKQTNAEGSQDKLTILIDQLQDLNEQLNQGSNGSQQERHGELINYMKDLSRQLVVNRPVDDQAWKKRVLIDLKQISEHVATPQTHTGSDEDLKRYQQLVEQREKVIQLKEQMIQQLNQQLSVKDKNLLAKEELIFKLSQQVKGGQPGLF